MEECTLHKHSREKEHGIALPAASRTEICAALAVSLWSEMRLNVLKQLDRSKILRIAANNLDVFI